MYQMSRTCPGFVVCSMLFAACHSVAEDDGLRKAGVERDAVTGLDLRGDCSSAAWRRLDEALDDLNQSTLNDLRVGRSQPMWAEVITEFRQADLTGNLQTPKGGAPGSTTHDRPTVDEIGIGGMASIPSIDMRLGHEDHEFHLNVVLVERSGSSTLSETLISQGETFPAGSTVGSGLGLDTFRFGYRPHFWGLGWRGWRITPEIGAGVAQFEYKLTSSAATGSVDREYDVGFPYIGVLIERPLTERLSLELDLAGSEGVNGVSYVDASLRALYNFGTGERSGVSLFLGWRGTRFRRADHQEQSNDVDLRFGAFSDSSFSGLTIGLQFTF